MIFLPQFGEEKCTLLNMNQVRTGLYQTRVKTSSTAAMAKTAVRTNGVCPVLVDLRALLFSFKGEDEGGGGRCSTWIASFMPPKQKPFPLMK